MAHRFYCELPLNVGDDIALPDQVAVHVARVLRLRVGSNITLFNGNGSEFSGPLTSVEKRSATVELQQCSKPDNESLLSLTLVQAIGKGDRMDWAIQKCVEMGVTAIQPIITERTVVQIKQDRAEKRQQHWQQVVISACEQSGRNIVPAVAPPVKLGDWCQQAQNGLVLDPTATMCISNMPAPSIDTAIVVGPEGGFSSDELETLSKAGIQRLRFGPRILRTETAGVSVMAALQAKFGDCG